MKKFKDEYMKIHKQLRSSYDGERRLIKGSKERIDQIWENAQNVKSAIRMANNEVEKMSELK